MHFLLNNYAENPDIATIWMFGYKTAKNIKMKPQSK